jgi:ribosomal protein S5
MIEFKRRLTSSETGESLRIAIPDPSKVVAVMETDEGPDYCLLRLAGGGKGIIVQGSYHQVLAILGVESEQGRLAAPVSEGTTTEQ